MYIFLFIDKTYLTIKNYIRNREGFVNDLLNIQIYSIYQQWYLNSTRLFLAAYLYFLGVQKSFFIILSFHFLIYQTLSFCLLLVCFFIIYIRG